MRLVPTLVLLSGARALKVTVVGGSGFVGSRVCKGLVDAGAEVVSVSKSGQAPAWCRGQAWAQKVDWRANDLCRGSRERLGEIVGTPDAVVSCVGAVGFDMQGLLLGNGVANTEAAGAARAAGAERMTYVSVGSEVMAASSWLPSYFDAYFQGKRNAEEAISAAFGESACFIKPTFIYGGDDFGLFPPRVSQWYGAIIEELLSKSIFVKGAELLPGLLGVALLPPVSVDSVAAACVAHAMGELNAGNLDGTPAINGVTQLPPASGLTDAIMAVKDKLGGLTEAQS